MKIEQIAIKDLKPYERNAKKHDETQIKNVMESIKQFGMAQPLAVDKDNVLIIGHCRLIACKRLKMKEVPVVRMDELTQEQVDKLRLLDNKLNESEWDFDLLAEDIPTLDFSGMQNHLDFAKEKGFTGGKKYEQGKVDEFHPEMIDAVFTIDADEMFLWGADYFAELLPNKNDGSWIVWDKRANGNDDVAEDYSSDKMYGSCFELCWSKKKHKRDIARVKWAGVFGTEQEFDHKRCHPTQKPIKLAGWFLDRYSKEGQVVIDLFGGSGSTLIACEQLNRKCYMCELDPHYIDVIIQRYINLKGTDKDVFLIRDGKKIPYCEVE